MLKAIKKEFYTAEELSKYLRIPRPTIYFLTQVGKIPAFKIGRHWRYKKVKINDWLKKQENIEKK